MKSIYVLLVTGLTVIWSKAQKDIMEMHSEGPGFAGRGVDSFHCDRKTEKLRGQRWISVVPKRLWSQSNGRGAFFLPSGSFGLKNQEVGYPRRVKVLRMKQSQNVHRLKNFALATTAACMSLHHLA